MSDRLLVAGMTFPLTKDRYVIGRGEGCDILLPADDLTASRQHATLEKEAVSGRWRLSDLGSPNGTFVANERIGAPHELADGDRIKIGETVMVLDLAKVAAPPPVVVESPAVAEETVRDSIDLPAAAVSPEPEAQAPPTIFAGLVDTVRLEEPAPRAVVRSPEPPRSSSAVESRIEKPPQSQPRGQQSGSNGGGVFAAGSTIVLIVSAFLPWITLPLGWLGVVHGSYVDGLKVLAQLGDRLPRAFSDEPKLALYLLPLAGIVLAICGLFGGVRWKASCQIVSSSIGLVSVGWLFSQFKGTAVGDLSQLLGSGVILFGLASLCIGACGIRGLSSK